MYCNRSKLATVALVAAIGLGVPALAKSTHSGRAKAVASQTVRGVDVQREHALNADESVQRSPTFGAPNPYHPAFIRGGSTGYNANLYVY
jgi:hypothetical protein